jgi:hypothetical protein
MTRLPIDGDQVRGVAGPDYKVGPRCCNPRCRRIAEHAHHIWPRSYLRGQPKNWVELPDGRVIGNKCAVCSECHLMLTGDIGGHKAAIRVGIEDLRLWWCKTAGENGSMTYEPLDPIDPQPPTREALVASPADVESDDCPTCGQPRARRRPSPAGRRRARKTWPVKVPDDAEENGAEVLDSLTEDLAPLLGLHPDDRGGYASGRYYVLVPALYFAQTKRDEFVRSILGRD